MIHPDYKSGKSLHEQIEEEIKQHIISGALKTDERLPSVRELSISLTVNPNTVQRAYKQLEQDGFIYSIKGKGNFVADVKKTANTERYGELYAALEATVRELFYLGETKEKLTEKIDTLYREKEGAL